MTSCFTPRPTKASFGRPSVRPSARLSARPSARRWKCLLAPSAVAMIFAGSLAVPEIASAKDLEVESRSRRSQDGDHSALSRWRDASPDERRLMRDSVRDRWNQATRRERRLFRRGMVGLRRALPEFSEIERLVLLRNLFALPKAERSEMRERLRGIDDLNPPERDRLVEELRVLANRPDEEPRRIERNVERWRGMSESDRDKYREQMRRFRALSIEERRKLLNEWEDPERSKSDVDAAPERPR